MQKLPEFFVPQDGQYHSAEAWGAAGAGLGEPHVGQKLPVLTAPHEQVQEPAGAPPAATAAPAMPGAG